MSKAKEEFNSYRKFCGIHEKIDKYIDELLEKNKWIRVEDRLPDHDKKVLVHPYGGRLGRYAMHGTKKWYCPIDFEEITVTHWMPFPETPEDK